MPTKGMMEINALGEKDKETGPNVSKDWQNKFKLLAESGHHIMRNSLYTDVDFLVGEKQGSCSKILSTDIDIKMTSY